MEKGPKIALAVTAVLVVAVGVRVGLIYKANHEPAPKVDTDTWERNVTDDDLVLRRKLRPDSVKDEKELVGKTVWVAAGGQVAYFPDTGKHADFAHPAGKLLGAEPLAVTEVFEQVAAKSGPGVTAVPVGKRQVFLGFTMPKSSDPAKKYAAPVGYYDDGAYTFLSDEMFFYDDPRVMYKAWGPAVWAHIDKHEAALGMSENQAMMALGQAATPTGQTVGNRSITFDNNGKPVTVDFVKNKAVTITPGG
jgi:hypothetical protein